MEVNAVNQVNNCKGASCDRATRECLENI